VDILGIVIIDEAMLSKTPCLTHSAAGERKRFFLGPMAEYFPTEDDVGRKANERRGGFRWHRV
jgi:hypothetical protein